MRVSRVFGASSLAVAAMVAGLLTGLPTAQAVAYPNATISSPADGSAATGTVTVVGDGQTDPGGTDFTATLGLLVDGMVTGALFNCPASSFDCPHSFSWDSSAAAAGAHTLQVELTTAAAVVVDSTPVVTVHVPAAPAVVINSPASESVTGPVDITATGTIDGASSDTPTSLQLVVGGTAYGSPVACTANPCTETISWDSTSYPDGAHSVRARFVTSGGNLTSSAITLTSSNPGPAVNITSPGDHSAQQGTIAVTATGTQDSSSSENPEKMELLEGGNVVDSTACDQAAANCVQTLHWDATGRSGNFVLTMKFSTTDGKSVTDTVNVDVSSPGPTASIVTPVTGQTVTGVVPVTTAGAVNASQTDTAKTMQLFVDEAAYGAAVGCPTSQGAKACPATFSWDATGVNGAHKLHVHFITNSGASVTSPDITVNASTNPPAVAVSAPANGSTVSGILSISTSGTIDPTQTADSPTSMQLLIDGVVTSPTATPCPANPGAPRVCTVPYTWDTTGLSGAHTLQAKFLTHKGLLVLSAVSTITIVSPGPTVAITSPVIGSTVHRAVTITVAGAVDPSQTDSPSSVAVTVDGVALGAAEPCTAAPAAPRTCSASFAWSTLGLLGKHTLAASLTTTNGVVGASVATSVYVYGGTQTAFGAVKTQPAGRTVTVSGRVKALINHSVVVGGKVKILIIPATGKSKSLYVHTNVKGIFAVRIKLAVNTTVEATMENGTYLGTSHTFTKLKVIPLASCVAAATIRRGRVDQASCRLPNLPKGTKVTLQYAFKGHWYSLGSGKAPGATIPFSFQFAQRGAYLVRIVLGSSRVFAGTTAPSLKVNVI